MARTFRSLRCLTASVVLVLSIVCDKTEGFTLTLTSPSALRSWQQQQQQQQHPQRPASLTPGKHSPLFQASITDKTREHGYEPSHDESESDDSTIHKLPLKENDGQNDRRAFLASSLLSASAALSVLPGSAQGLPLVGSLPLGKLRWEAVPNPKRSGVTVFEAEKFGYNVRFVTYLSRFLLNFDDDCQRWWSARTAELSRQGSPTEVEALRLQQFAAFATSVEVGLQEYEGPEGARCLLQKLLQRYGPPSSETNAKENYSPRVVTSSVVVEADQPVSFATRIGRTFRRGRDDVRQSEARRQVALLFGLMDDERYQPVKDLTKLLAAIDDAGVTSVVVNEMGSGYLIDKPPCVGFPSPEAGATYRGATGRAVLIPTGKLNRIKLIGNAEGERNVEVRISAPKVASFSSDKNSQTSRQATAVAVYKDDGRLVGVQLVDRGAGYTANETVTVQLVSSIDGRPLKDLTARVELDYGVGAVEITDPGEGYALLGSPLEVVIEPPPADGGVVPATATAYSTTRDAIVVEDDKAQSQPQRAVFSSVLNSQRPTTVDTNSGTTITTANNSDGDNSGSSKTTSPSQQLLYLLPGGVGLEFNARKGIYELANAQAQAKKMWMTPEFFGPRGRAPIERSKDIDVDTALRLSVAGAICCSGVHLFLTPMDVVKTKLQTETTNDNETVFSFAQRIVRDQGGPSALFNGWVPTTVGFFLWGGVTYTCTEFFRRTLLERFLPSLLEFLSSSSSPIGSGGGGAELWEVPMVILAAGFAAFGGSFILAPFEAVRIRSVAQPDYGGVAEDGTYGSALAISSRMVEEEGLFSLFSAVPAMLWKEVPFACAKFAVFDVVSTLLYQQLPAAAGDLRLSLAVSLVSGTAGGIAAAVVSNPADATVSEMKKAVTDASVTPSVAFQRLWDRGGLKAIFKGLGIRMVFYSLVVSLQFLVYDSVRFYLGVGSDDLKLYLDVLGGALSSSSTQAP